MLELTVLNMTCGHCVKTITRAVRSIDPGARVEANVDTKRVRIDSSRSMDELSRALADAGYPASTA